MAAFRDKDSSPPEKVVDIAQMMLQKGSLVDKCGGILFATFCTLPGFANLCALWPFPGSGFSSQKYFLGGRIRAKSRVLGFKANGYLWPNGDVSH